MFSRKFEESKFGEIALSTLVVLFLVTGVAWNLPYSAIGRALNPLTTPIAQATGLSQGWSMFAPNPIRSYDSVEVQATMSDGAVRIWDFKQPPQGLNRQFAWEHWRNLSYFLINQGDTRYGFMRWVIHKFTNSTERPVHIELIWKSETMPQDVRDEPGATTVTKLWIEDLSSSN